MIRRRDAPWICGKEQQAEILRTDPGTPGRFSVYARNDLVTNSTFPNEWFETMGEQSENRTFRPTRNRSGY